MTKLRCTCTLLQGLIRTEYLLYNVDNIISVTLFEKNGKWSS